MLGHVGQLMGQKLWEGFEGQSVTWWHLDRI